MADFSRKADNEWQWQQGRKTHSVRYFPTTKRLVWSAWQDTSEGPRFDEGYAQTVDNFLQDGVPGREPPPALIAELQSALQTQPASTKGPLAWLRRGGR